MLEKISTQLSEAKSFASRQTGRKHGAYFILEIAFFLVFVAIITAAASSLLSDTDGDKAAAARMEADQIRIGIERYTAYTSKSPGTSGAALYNALTTDISASDAIDSMNHKATLASNARWDAAGSLVDPWGNAYVITDGAVKSGGPDGTVGSGDDDIVVYISNDN